MIEPNDRLNILTGDNETGKSSVLEAIDLVACGNVHKVESIGLDKLICLEAVKIFQTGNRTFENLPKLFNRNISEWDGRSSFRMATDPVDNAIHTFLVREL